MRRLMVCLVVMAGCWEEQRVDDLFSEDEWQYLQTFRIDRLPAIPCDGCEPIARFGHQLFFDPRYSGPLAVASDAGAVGETGKIACDRCHDPKAYFSDDTASSLGASWTGRNAPGLVDLAYRVQFTWVGEYQTIADVLRLALTSKAAMSSTAERLVEHITTFYAPTYDALFPGQRGAMFENAALAIGTYEAQLVSGPSPFDLYLAGDTTAIDPSAKRGARLFIGKALCSECHDGPLFTDDKFHVTGVEQRGEHAKPIDRGRAEITGEALDDGRFRTPSLRHVAKTAPYMHAGQLETLADVIELYRWGGDPGGFVGTKDPRMVPLELSDADVRDLEAFLLALTGAPVDDTWTTKPVLP